MRCTLSFLLLLGNSCRIPGTGVPTPTVVARARLLRIEDTRRDEPALLDSLLVDPEPTTRAAAAITAGRLGGVAHRSLLRAIASDGDSAVAANALFSLGLLKDTASLGVASAALRKAPTPAREAAWLLGELGEVGRPAIERALRDASLPPATRGALLLAAARLRPVPVAAIVPMLTSPDSDLAWRAAYAIARGRGLAGVRLLLAQANAPWAAVREQVARAAARGLSGDSLGGEAQRLLATLMRDVDAHVRINAARSLASYGVASRSALLAALPDGDVNVRVAVAQSLDSVIGADASEWRRAFDADTTFMVRRSLAEGAARHGVELIGRAHWATSGDWRLRAVAAELAGIGSAASAAPHAAEWLHDDDGRVRAVASAALARLADSAATRAMTRALLRASLADGDVGVRAQSLGGLALGASAEDLRSALVSYRRFLADPDNDARLAFWRIVDSAMTRFGTALPDSLAHELDALARPADPVERARAASIGRFAAWKTDAGTAQSMAWYEARAMEVERSDHLTLRLQTERGTMELALYTAESPLTVYNIVTLARAGYFDGQRFHRVVPNFVVQAGDPRGDGTSGPGYAIRDELNRRRYGRGTLGMALSGPNTGGSQFFITHAAQPHLDGGYTVFGELVSGFEALDRVVQGDRIVRVTVH